MTISSENRKAGPYIGNGATTSYAFAFKVFQASELLVVKSVSGVESTLVLGTDYTVTLNADQNASPGGTITLTTALPSSVVLVITSDVQNLQTMVLTNVGAFYPEVVNAALDRTTIQIQQLDERLSRAVIAPITSEINPTELIAELVQASENAVAAAEAAEASADRIDLGALDDAVASAQASETAAVNSATSATSSASSAAASASTASAASTSAFVNANVYASTAAGVAAVADGVQFQVVSADGLTIKRWQRSGAAAVAVPGAEYPSRLAIPLPVSTSSTGNAIVATSASPITTYTDGRDYVLQLPSNFAGVTINVPTLAIDGLAALPIYTDRNEPVRRSLFRPGAIITVRKQPFFGGLFQLVSSSANNKPFEPIVAVSSSTTDTIVGTSVTGEAITEWEDNREYVIQLPGNFAGGVADIPTVKIDGAPALPLYGGDFEMVEKTKLKPTAWLRFRRVANFGGIAILMGSDGLPANKTSNITLLFTSSDNGTAAVTTGDGSAWATGRLYLYRPLVDAVADVPTMARDGLPPLGIYNSSANNLPRGFLRANRTYILGYSPSFGGLLYVFGSEQPRAIADVYRGIQSGEEAKEAVRDIYRALVYPVPASFTTVWENTFDNSTDCQAALTAHGANDSQSTPTYDPLTYVAADGGYGLIDCNTGGGMWSDHNHIWPGPGMLNLLAVFNRVGRTQGGVAGQIPDFGSIKHLRLELELRASSLYLPPETQLLLHLQMQDASIGSGGTGKPLNFVYTAETIHNVLGFGDPKAGLGWPHLRTTSRTSDWVTFRADLEPNAAFWKCIGTSDSRKDTYAGGSIARVMDQPYSSFLNMMVVALHPQQDDKTSMPIQRVTGALHIRRAALLRPA